MSDSETRVVEPLAKFHVQVYKNGRIAIPGNEREYFGLDKHDIVNLVVRKVVGGKIIGRGQFWAQLTVHGRLTIPNGLREELNIKEGDQIEVLLIDFIKLKNKVGDKAYQLFQAVKSGKYFIIGEEEEQIVGWADERLQRTIS